VPWRPTSGSAVALDQTSELSHHVQQIQNTGVPEPLELVPWDDQGDDPGVIAGAGAEDLERRRRVAIKQR